MKSYLFLLLIVSCLYCAQASYYIRGVNRLLQGDDEASVENDVIEIGTVFWLVIIGLTALVVGCCCCMARKSKAEVTV